MSFVIFLMIKDCWVLKQRCKEVAQVPPQENHS